MSVCFPNDIFVTELSYFETPGRLSDMLSSPTVRSTRLARRWAVRLAAPIALAVLLPTTVSAEPANRDQTVAGLQRRAAEVAAELNRLDLATNQIEEDYNSAALELASLRELLGANQREVDAAQVAVSGRRDAARTAAVRAFVGETDAHTDAVDIGAFDDMATDSRRRTYLTSVVGNSAQVIDDLGQAQQDLDDRQRRLEQSASKVDRQVAELQGAQADLEAKIAQRQQLRSSLDGQLGAAVEAERERQAAAEEARLAAEARAAAARQRNAERMSATAIVRAAVDPGPGSAPLLTAAPTALAPPANDVAVATGSATPGGDQAVQAALAQLGDRYRWGAVGPDSFDCSGLVTFAYRGIASLPRSSRAMRSATRRISEEQLLPGDLVFGGSPVHHVGIYIGNGQMVHSPQSGDVVKVSGIYRSSGPVSFGRI